MLSHKIQDALNEQINAELYSAYLYYAMEAYFASQGLSGCAHWMKLQALEELGHAHRMVNCINERGGRVNLKPIEGPPAEWDSPLSTFKAVSAHERKVTGLINKLVDLAIQESDHATNNFLQWFVAEQVEEEASADEIVQKMGRAESAPGGLFMLDGELGQRPFTLPPEFAGGEK